MANTVSGFPNLACRGVDDTDRRLKNLQAFNLDNRNAFVFGTSDVEERLEFTGQLLKIVESAVSSNVQHDVLQDCLEALVVMSRDAVTVVSGQFASKETWERLLVLAGLKDRNEIYSRKVNIFACKCLSNVIFLTKDSKGFCCDDELVAAIKLRLQSLNPLPSSSDELELEFLTLRLLFLISVFNTEARTTIVDLHDGRRLLINRLTAKLKSCKRAEDPLPCQRCSLAVEQSKSCSEMLKTLFNLNIKAHNEESQVREEKIVTEFHDLVSVCRKCLLCKVENESSAEKLHSDAMNCLYSVPSSCFDESCLIPEFKQSTADAFSYEGNDTPVMEGRDVSAILNILTYVENKIESGEITTESLQPVLSLLSHLSRNSRCIRKFCKTRVIPPRKDFDHRPEVGPEFRNKLVKLFTNANTEVKAAAADFVFVLCKEKVDRLVKYTGYGNSAGLLASRGLLAGGQGDTIYSDTDSDSDTEEYRKNVDKINPITGHVPPEMPNPMEGMSEEQKEYLAVQLANQLSKLSSDDVIKPVCVDPNTGNLIPFQQKVHETVVPEEKESDDDDSD